MPLALPIGSSPRSCCVPPVTATRSRQPSTAPTQHFLLHLPIMHQEVSISFYPWKSPFAGLLPAYSHLKPFSEESNAPRVRSLAPTAARRQQQVVADVAELSIGREEYYTRELATDHEAYLSGHGESPGRWYGAGATSLGLQGEASVAGFETMFEGRDPTTGQLLGRPHGRNAVPAFDLVLRPTKSVS